jgi:two-component system, OmpR family, alkaline phosphatase synthesis response regulator PhoP
MAEKVLMLVDDEQAILDLLETILEGEGYKVVKALNGEEALKKLEKVKPDLLLLDFFMPGMSGLDVCKKIRENSKLKDLKIAFLTVARFDKKAVADLKKFNVLDYITKPFDAKDLVKRIKKMVGL